MSNRYQWDAGKGSWKRPREVSKQQYEDNWDRIFKKDKDVDPEVVEAKSAQVCEACNGEGGIYDAGWFYECKSCKDTVAASM